MASTDKPLEIGLVTASGERMLSFYCGVLGFESVAQIPFPGVGTIHRLHSGARVIKLLALDSAPPEEPVQGEFTATTGIRYLTLWVEDLEATVAACRAHGSSIPVEPKPLRPGVRVAMATDPDANTIEMMAEA